MSDGSHDLFGMFHPRELIQDRPSVPAATTGARGAGLVGQPRADMEALLGPPLMVMREGAVTMLQWRTAGSGRDRCVLDLYVTPRRGRDEVVRVEARDGLMNDTAVAPCLEGLARR